jgi:hypothetical protein
MSTLPQPQPCGQNWLGMTPTAHGRQCGQCAKEIYDFSAMSWPEIERVQAAHGNALCGMYAARQLAHWGQQPPTACARLAAATTLAWALASLPAQGQHLPKPAADSVRITGTVTVEFEPGKPEPAPGVTVVANGTALGTSTNGQGHFELVLPTSVIRSPTSAILFSRVGYQSSMLTLPTETTGVVRHDVLLTPTPAIVYAVERPSLARRIKWRLRQWLTPGR